MTKNPNGATAAEQRARFTLTTKGWAATVPRRRECGHVICTGRDHCAFLPPTSEAS